jgi:signal transduction histidine kinase
MLTKNTNYLKMNKTILLVFLFLSLFGFCKTDQSKDSLIHCLSIANNDSNKVKLLQQLVKLTKSNSTKDALLFAQHAVDLSEKINFKLVECYNDLALQYKNLTNYKKSLEIYYKAEKIALTSQSPKKEFHLGVINSGIASVYGSLHNYDLAIYKCLKAIENFTIIKNTRKIASSYINLGNYYYYKSDYSMAVFNYKKAENYFSGVKDSAMLTYCYNCLGSVYFQIKNYTAALNYFNKFHDNTIHEKSADLEKIAVAKQNLGQAYNELGDTKKAIELCLEAITLFKKLQDFANLYISYENLAKYYSKSGNFETSNKYYTLYAHVKDSVFNVTTQNTIQEMAIKYESEKNEQENELLRLQENNEKQLKFIAFGICVFLLIVLFLIVKAYIVKQGALKKEMELNELKSQLISTASHEFLTPLTTIASSAELIEKYIEIKDEGKQKNHLSKIQASVFHLKSIFSDFLTQEKIKSGKIQHNPELLNVRELIDNIINENTINFSKQKIVLLDSEIIEDIVADKVLLKTAINNLVKNACKYSREGGEVKISIAHQKNQISFVVQDQGIGIPKNDHDFLFEPFFRTSNSKNIQGTGIGLNLTKKFVTMMGGSISFTSEENVGSTFKISLPL